MRSLPIYRASAPPRPTGDLMAMFSMTIGMFRGIVTGTLLVLFISLAIWAWSKARREQFDAAARLPLEEEGE
jgi:cytochrome c oxidase cbb3-type subunit 4